MANLFCAVGAALGIGAGMQVGLKLSSALEEIGCISVEFHETEIIPGLCVLGGDVAGAVLGNKIHHHFEE